VRRNCLSDIIPLFCIIITLIPNGFSIVKELSIRESLNTRASILRHVVTLCSSAVVRKNGSKSCVWGSVPIIVSSCIAFILCSTIMIHNKIMSDLMGIGINSCHACRIDYCKSICWTRVLVCSTARLTIAWNMRTIHRQRNCVAEYQYTKQTSENSKYILITICTISAPYSARLAWTSSNFPSVVPRKSDRAAAYGCVVVGST
jgi:hypothetical protein